MSPAQQPEALAIAFNRAIVAHFGEGARADAEEVLVAACSVTASYIAAVADPITRGVLLAQAQWVLRRTVAETAAADAKKAARERRRPFDG